MSNRNESGNRNESLDILKVLSMYMVLVLHFLANTGRLDNTDPFSYSFIISWLLESVCYVAVNCFVLTTGYFAWKRKFKSRHIITLSFTAIFYSLIFIIVEAIMHKNVSVSILIKSILPIFTRHYWFITVYCLLYAISPFINMLISVMDKTTHKKLIIVLFALFCVIPTLIPFEDYFQVNAGQSLQWFIFLYILAAYISKYRDSKIHAIKWPMVNVFAVLLLFCSKIVIAAITLHFKGVAYGSAILFRYNSILVFMSAFALFLSFLNHYNTHSKIGKISAKLVPYVVSVYLITENLLVRDKLWQLVDSLIGKNIMWPISMFLILIIIYAICIGIDVLRKKIFDIFRVNCICELVDAKIHHYQPSKEKQNNELI